MPIINASNGQPAGKDMGDKAKQFRDLVVTRLPNHAVELAQDIVDKSFQGEKYAEKSSTKWKGRKKEEQPGKARSERRALLVKTGALIGSTSAERRGADVIIGSDKPYSQIHNEGGKMGNGGQMPQRQFMPKPGESNKELESQLDKFMDNELDKIFG